MENYRGKTRVAIIYVRKGEDSCITLYIEYFFKNLVYIEHSITFARVFYLDELSPRIGYFISISTASLLYR